MKRDTEKIRQQEEQKYKKEYQIQLNKMETSKETALEQLKKKMMVNNNAKKKQEKQMNELREELSVLKEQKSSSVSSALVAPTLTVEDRRRPSIPQFVFTLMFLSAGMVLLRMFAVSNQCHVDCELLGPWAS